MHSLLEGAIKNFFSNWFNSNHREEFSNKEFLKEINKRHLNIKPPAFIPYCPRPIYDWHKWRAHEYLAFLLFYALPVFYGIVSQEIYSNLIKLVIAIEVLLSPSINREKLAIVREIIKEFVSEAQEIYTESILCFQECMKYCILLTVPSVLGH